MNLHTKENKKQMIGEPCNCCGVRGISYNQRVRNKGVINAVGFLVPQL